MEEEEHWVILPSYLVEAVEALPCVAHLFYYDYLQVVGVSIVENFCLLMAHYSGWVVVVDLMVEGVVDLNALVVGEHFLGMEEEVLHSIEVL